MRFFLDHDVDAAVGSLIRQNKHDAWTASDAGLHDAADDDLTIYAQSRDAVLMTHDSEFSQRRRQNTIGRHVWLHCQEPDAVSILSARLEDLVRLIDGHDDCFVTVSRDKMEWVRQWA